MHDHDPQHTPPTPPSGVRTRWGLSRTRLWHLALLAILSLMVGALMQSTTATYSFHKVDLEAIKAAAPAVLLYALLITMGGFLSTRDGTTDQQPALPGEIALGMGSTLPKLGVGSVICHVMPILVLPMLTAMTIDFLYALA